MMKKLACLAACVISAVALSACSSFEIGSNTNDVKFTTSDAETLAHVNADIWGVYVFGLPVISGSSVEPGKCVVFSDTVDTGNAVSFLTRNAQKKLLHHRRRPERTHHRLARPHPLLLLPRRPGLRQRPEVSRSFPSPCPKRTPAAASGWRKSGATCSG